MRALLLLSALASSAAAQEGGEQPRSMTSADLREAGSFGVGLGLGTFLVPISGSALHGFYSFKKDLQLELQLWGGTFDGKDIIDKEPTVRLDHLDLKGSLAQFRLKYFVGNSFYVAGAFGSRRIEFDLQASNILGDMVRTELESDAVFAGIAIGNTWTFGSGFFIGGEWVAVSVPLASEFSSETTETSASSTPTDLTDLQAEAEDSAKDLGEVTTLGLATLYLGWQF